MLLLENLRIARPKPDDIKKIETIYVTSLDRTKISIDHIEEKYQITRQPMYGELYKNETDINPIKVGDEFIEKGDLYYEWIKIPENDGTDFSNNGATLNDSFDVKAIGEYSQKSDKATTAKIEIDLTKLPHITDTTVIDGTNEKDKDTATFSIDLKKAYSSLFKDRIMFEITQNPKHGDLKSGESKINIGSTFSPSDQLTYIRKKAGEDTFKYKLILKDKDNVNNIT